MTSHKNFDSNTFEIEEAPNVNSLDELLDPDNTYAYNINKPHIRVKTKALINVMTTSRKISEYYGRDAISRTIGLKVSSGRLQVLLSNQDDYAKISLELDNKDNKDNILEDFIPINFDYLNTLIHSSFDYFVLYKDKDTYFVKVLGGDIQLATQSIHQEQMELKEKYKDIGVIDREDFNMVKKCGLLAKNSISRSQKRVFINNNEVIGFSIKSNLLYQSKKNLPNVILRLRDVQAINLMIGICQPKDLTVATNTNRTFVYTDAFTYSFNRVNCDNLKKSYAISTNVPPISIKLSKLKKLGFLSTKYPGSQEVLRFNYADDGQIQCLVLLKNYNFRVVLGKDNKNKFLKLDADIKISTMCFSQLVSIFDSIEVNLFLTKEALIIQSGELTGICYGREET